MARVVNDLWKISSYVFEKMPWYVRSIMITNSLTGILALGSSAGYKVVRWISRDSTNYIPWNDTKGQIERLATERFSEIKGALAPSAIFDRRGLPAVDSAAAITAGFFSTIAGHGIIALSGGAALIFAALSLSECQSLGDGSNSDLSQQCWNHLGLFGQEPALLSALATAYTASHGSIIPILLGGISVFASSLMVSHFANGFGARYMPTFLRTKGSLLTERYELLGKKLTEFWKEVQSNEDLTSRNGLIRKAELLKRRSKLIALGLEEYFSLSKEESIKVIEPLIKAAEQIIKEKK